MKRFLNKKMILRDHLAADRTRMANERTLLSYLRTFIMILASGVTFIKVFPENNKLFYTGVALIPIAIILLAIGVYSYAKVRKEMKELYKNQK